MFVWLVRHAIATERHPGASPQEDAGRKLTRKGRKRFAALASHLNSTVEPPDFIVSSPIVRAVQTAEILREECNLKEDQVCLDERIACGMSPVELAAVIAAHPSVGLLAVVGHEPDLSRGLSEFVGGARVKFAKGAIACLELDSNSPMQTAHLQWFATTDLA